MRSLLPAPVMFLALAIAACSDDPSAHGDSDSGSVDAGTSGPGHAAPSPPDATVTFDFEETLDEAQTCERHTDCSWARTQCGCILDLGDVTPLRRDFVDRVTVSCTQRCRVQPSPYLVPRCDAGRCAVFDTRQLSASACEVDGDCVLRVRECCECGGDASIDAVIALSRDHVDYYTELVCDPGAVCDACLPEYPATRGLGPVSMMCDEGHCIAEPSGIELGL